MCWGNYCYRLPMTNFVLLERLSKLDNTSLQQIIDRIPLLKCRNFDSVLSDYVPILPNASFALIYTQPSNTQGEHLIMLANARHNLYFADSLGRATFSKKQHKQMLPQPIQTHPSVCGFFTINATFHLFEFRQEEFTGVHNVHILSFITNYM